jgi:hypothetical protein
MDIAIPIRVAANHAQPILGERIAHAPWLAEALINALQSETQNSP